MLASSTHTELLHYSHSLCICSWAEWPDAITRLVTSQEFSVRSNLVGNAGSRPISEAKQPWACLVLRWGTTGEAHVLYSPTIFVPKNEEAGSLTSAPPPPSWPPSRDPIGLQPFSKCSSHFRSDFTLFPQFAYHKQPTFCVPPFPTHFLLVGRVAAPTCRGSQPRPSSLPSKFLMQQSQSKSLHKP